MQGIGISFLPVMLGMEPRTSFMLSNCSFTESYLSLDSQLGACEL